MKKYSKNSHNSLNELNITPLLDLAFVLLVIFIITTPQLSNDLEMNLPTPKKDNPPPTKPPKINRIVVDKEGHILLNDQVMELPVLKETLLAMKSADKEASIVLRGSANVDYQRVISVLDILQQTEVKVGLATETTD